MVKNMPSKTKDILAYMRENPWITNMDAVSKFGAYRLGSIIHSLRKQGYNITTVMVDGFDIYGKSVKYARYVLHD